MVRGSKYKWCIFRLDNKTFTGIHKELVSKGYDLKLCIPTISILKKRVKGKDIYEEIPLLFNYGFIRIPTEQAFSRPFINKLKKDISGIVTFLNSSDSLHPKKLRKRVDGEDFDDFSIVATVLPQEVRRLRKISKENKVYGLNELARLKEGDYVTLKGYPFDGVDATIKEVNINTRMAKVALYPNNGNMEIIISFDNFVYSPYQSFDESKLLSQQNELIVDSDSQDPFKYFK